jgi:hypothetical protein
MGDDIGLFTKLYCPDYHDNVFADVMVLTRFSTILLTLLSFAVGLWYKELYLVLLGFGLTLDSLINWGLREALGEPPPYLGCGYGPSMPCFFSQHAFFAWTALVTFPFFWKARLTLWHILLVTGFAFASCFGQVYLAFNTPAQVLVGSMVGMVLGLIFQIIVYFFAYPYFECILNWRLSGWLGYQNSVCVPGKDDLLSK